MNEPVQEAANMAASHDTFPITNENELRMEPGQGEKPQCIDDSTLSCPLNGTPSRATLEMSSQERGAASLQPRNPASSAISRDAVFGNDHSNSQSLEAVLADNSQPNLPKYETPNDPCYASLPASAV